MHVLVTGATGFVGRAVVARLLADGRRVSALSRDVASARAILPEPVSVLRWSGAAGGDAGSRGPGEQPPAWALSLPSDLDAVIHLAGASIAGGLWTKSRKQVLWTSRVDGTRALVRALEASGSFPKALVCASGMGWHGDAGARPVHPDDPPGADFLGTLARAWEAEAEAARGLGARVARVRLGMVLGADGGALPPLARATRWGLGAVLGDGAQYWPWIGLDDAAGLFARAVDDPRCDGALHAASGEPVTQRTFAKTLGAVLRRPVVARVPAWALRAGLGDMADLFLHGQRATGPEWAPFRGETLAGALTRALTDARSHAP